MSEDAVKTSCRVCGCTDERACSPPCRWFDPTLCTTCALAAEAVRGWLAAAVEPSMAKLLHEAGAGVNPRVIDTSDADLVRMIAVMLDERAEFIAGNVDDIAVRVRMEDHWKNCWLSELPAGVLLREGFRLLLRSGPLATAGEPIRAVRV